MLKRTTRLAVVIIMLGLLLVACTPQPQEPAAALPPSEVENAPSTQEPEIPDSPGVPTPNLEGPTATRVAVLMYHHLAPKPDPANYGLIIDPEEFESQVAYLKDNAYYTPNLQELAAFVAGEAPLPEKSVVITFDDGYESNYLYAFPILQKYGLRAVIFPIGNEVRLDGANPPGWHTYLSEEQMREMHASGLIEFGSHTYAMHDYYNGVPCLQAFAAADIAADLEQGEEMFAHIGLPRSIAIAYPFGKYGDAAKTACQAVGYRLAFTTKSGRVSNASDALALPRMRGSGGLSTAQFADLVR